MAVELKVPTVGESITEVMIAVWHKQTGERVELDETVVELESDKATLELPAPAAGTVGKLLKRQGEMAQVGEVIGYIETGGVSEEQPAFTSSKTTEETAPKSAPPQPLATQQVMPAAARLMAEKGLSAQEVHGTGRDGRILKEDVLNHIATEVAATSAVAASAVPAVDATPAIPAPVSPPVGVPTNEGNSPELQANEELVPMSPIRKRIGQRLLEAQSGMALLTTFNEIDMTAVIALRTSFLEQFKERYAIKLGFMSFFVKAAIEALKQVPQVNAEIRDANIVYKNHYDIGIAIGGGKGLVVPVVHDADRLSFAEVELAIADFGQRAKVNKIDLEELKGGTFTISNGGVYGSLLSTPIVNPPQSGVLGLHTIQERPVALAGQVVIRPMMYVALTYDHRIIDGRESVMFLKRIKELIEEPARLLLEV